MGCPMSPLARISALSRNSSPSLTRLRRVAVEISSRRLRARCPACRRASESQSRTFADAFARLATARPPNAGKPRVSSAGAARDRVAGCCASPVRDGAGDDGARARRRSDVHRAMRRSGRRCLRRSTRCGTRRDRKTPADAAVLALNLQEEEEHLSQRDQGRKGGLGDHLGHSGHLRQSADPRVPEQSEFLL